MKRAIRLILTVLALLAVASLLFYAFMPRPVEVDVATVARGPMRVGVEEDGQTRIRERYTISAPLAGVLQRIILEPGDPVVAEETLLATIDPTDPALLDVRAQAQAEARVRQARASVSQAEAQLERAEAALDYESGEQERILGLFERGVAGNAEVQQAEFRVEAARQDVRSAEFARQVAEFEVEQAEAAVLRTQGEPATQESDDASPADDPRLRLVSPVDGVVLRRFQESVAVVSPGTPLLEVGDPGDLEVVVDVLSTDAVQIQPGTPVIIERWGGGEPLRGAVRVVEPAAFTKISALGVEEQRVNVIIDLLTPPEARGNLGDAYRVEADIVLWEEEDVLQVPAGALFRRNEQWSVFAIEDGVAVERPVVVGHRSGLSAEVLEGLDENQQVVAYPSDRVADGQQVTPR